MLERFTALASGARLIGAANLATSAVAIWPVCAARLSRVWRVAFRPLAAWRKARLAAAKPSVLTANVPFRYVQHPFCASYLVFWSAARFTTTSSACWMNSSILSICCIIAARKEDCLMTFSGFRVGYAGCAFWAGMLST